MLAQQKSIQKIPLYGRKINNDVHFVKTYKHTLKLPQEPIPDLSVNQKIDSTTLCIKNQKSQLSQNHRKKQHNQAKLKIYNTLSDVRTARKVETQEFISKVSNKIKSKSYDILCTKREICRNASSSIEQKKSVKQPQMKKKKQKEKSINDKTKDLASSYILINDQCQTSTKRYPLDSKYKKNSKEMKKKDSKIEFRKQITIKKKKQYSEIRNKQLHDKSKKMKLKQNLNKLYNQIKGYNKKNCKRKDKKIKKIKFQHQNKQNIPCLDQNQKESEYNDKEIIEILDKNATLIQKIFRGYLTRKYVRYYKQVLAATIKIQTFWREYRIHKLNYESMIAINQQIKSQDISLIQQRIKPKVKKIRTVLNQHQLRDQEQILKRKEIEKALKQAANISAISAISNHQDSNRNDQNYQDRIRIPREYQKQKVEKSQSKLISMEDIEEVIESRQKIIIQRFQKQKNMIEKLFVKRLLSPNSYSCKKQDNELWVKKQTQNLILCKVELIRGLKVFNETLEKTQKDKEFMIKMDRFDKGNLENQANIDIFNILEWQGFKTPLSNNKVEFNYSQQNKRIIQELKSQLQEPDQKRIDQTSYQIAQYQQQPPKFDTSIQFIKDYFIDLSVFIINNYRQEFMKNWKTNYLQKQVGIELIVEENIIEQFNQQYKVFIFKKKLARNTNQDHYDRVLYQQIYLKLLFHVLNQSLSFFKPYNIHYPWSPKSYREKSKAKLIQDQIKLNKQSGILNSKDQSLIDSIMALAAGKILKWGSAYCGLIPFEDIEVNQADQEYIRNINNERLGSMLQSQTEYKWINFGRQEIEIKEDLGQQVYGYILNQCLLQLLNYNSCGLIL